MLAKASAEMDDERFHAAIAAFDARNALDPEQEQEQEAGAARPKALLQAERLSDWVSRLDPAASVALRLAARCQHLERWTVPRTDFPAGRVGYLRWRKELSRYHADESAKVLRKLGYDDATVEGVRRINLKQDLRSPDTQTMEDALCLVFLQYELDDFSQKYPDENKAIAILQKTWRKMSERGHQAALALPLSPAGRALVERALAAPVVAEDENGQ